MPLLNFPNELLLQVASNLDLPATRSLVLTNRRLNSLLTPRLHVYACDTDHHCTTALYLAAANQRPPLVSLLLYKGTDITVSTDTTPTTLLYHRHPREFDSSSVLTKILSSAPNIIVQDRKYGKTPLHYAAESGNEKLVRTLLDHGHPINIKDHDFDSALLAALKNHHTAIATLLINRGANIHAEARRGHTTFHLTAAWGHETIVSLMLDKGAKLESRDRDGHTVLHDAAQTGKKDMVRMLLRRGAKINARVIDPPWGGFHPLEANRRESDGDTALHLAVRRNHTAVVDVLVGAGADTSLTGRDGETALALAQERGYTQIVESLKRQYRGPNDRAGETQLHRAAYKNDAQQVSMLLSRGANINARKKTGETPLHVAVEEDNQEVVRVLLSAKGCDIDAQSMFGETALYKAVVVGNLRMVQLLLERGADRGVKNVHGRAAVDMARNLKFGGVVRLLEEGGTVGVIA